MIQLLKLDSPNLIRALWIHVTFGVLITLEPRVIAYWQLLILFIGCYEILSSRDSNSIAGIYAAYFAGMEVLVRMSRQTVFWELGKYGVVLLLLLGIISSGRKTNATFLVYFLLLVPSIFVAGYIDFMQARDMVSFNLSGPLCLAVSAVYFHKYQCRQVYLVVMIRAMVMPLIVMLLYLIVRTPDFSNIDFDTSSNMLASGGYGPNQVSLALGGALFFLITFQLIGVKFSGYTWLDYILIIMFGFRALLTFSRGGVIGALLALVVLMVGIFYATKSRRLIFRIVAGVVFSGICSWLVWDYANGLTKDTLTYRYAGVNPKTGKEEEYTTGRLLIMQRDIRLFQENPVLGVGPGQSKLGTSELKGKRVTAHTEWTRILAEHGFLGLVSLLILFIAPVVHAMQQKIIFRGLLLAFFCFAMFSMFHAAMRLAIISYLYAWALIIPINEKSIIRRK